MSNFGTVIAIIYNPIENKIPVVLNTEHRSPKLKFPGGCIEYGESPGEAAMRELREETFLCIEEKAIYRLLKPRNMGEYFLHVYGGKINSFAGISKKLVRDGDSILKTSLITPDDIIGNKSFLLPHREVFEVYIHILKARKLHATQSLHQ